MQQERAALEEKLRDLQVRDLEARQARAAAERALTGRTALIAQIDARRDLNAQFAGELQVAAQRLQQQMASLGSGQPVVPVAVPLAPFRGALDWPVTGRISGPFGQPSGRFGERPSGTASKLPLPRGPPCGPSIPARCRMPIRSPASETW